MSLNTVTKRKIKKKQRRRHDDAHVNSNSNITNATNNIKQHLNEDDRSSNNDNNNDASGSHDSTNTSTGISVDNMPARPSIWKRLVLRFVFILVLLWLYKMYVTYQHGVDITGSNPNARNSYRH